MREEAIKAKLEAMLPRRIDDLVPFNGINVHVPLRYTDARAFMVFMRADAQRVKAMIGSDRMTPVRLPGKKCVLGLTVFDFGTCDVGPYRELALSIPVLLDSRFNLPLVPLLFERMFPLLGFLTLQLAMTTDIARAHSDRFFWLSRPWP